LDRTLIKNPYIKISLLLLVITLLILISTPSIQENKITQLLTDTDNRNINLGKVLAPSEAYKMSPFAVDFSFGDKVNENHILFQSLKDNQVDSILDHKEHHRIYLSRPGDIFITYNVTRPISKSPRLSLYNDEFQLISSGERKNASADKNTYSVKFSLEAGLYRLKQTFTSKDLETISLKYRPRSESQEEKYTEYLDNNIKSVHLRVFPGQLVKLNELRDARAKNWGRLPSGDWSKRYLPSPKETLQASIRSKYGDWGIAEIGLSGRNQQHRSPGGLPSLDIKIRAGELPYGLKRFKLYTLPSKSRGLDMFMEQLIGDFGLPMYREDIVKVYLNNEYVGLMQLWEAVDSSFFEHSQIAEGPVIGYDTDSLIANPGHSWFVPKNYFKPKQISLENQIDLASLALNKKTCQDTQSKALSLGLFYAGMHGLGSDTKYHYNPRLDCFSPLYKDFNAGVLHLAPSDSQYETLLKSLTAFSVLTPNWRPYTPTYSSYFVYRNQRSEDEQQGFFWWTVTPPVMNHALSSSNDSAFSYNLKRLYSNWHQSRVSNRLTHFDTATKYINRTTQNSEKFTASIRYPNLSEVVDWKHWNRLFSQTEPCVESPTSELIYLSSNNILKPSCRELRQFSWRNNLIAKLTSSDKGAANNSDNSAELFKSKAKSGIASFLYQKNTERVLHVFFSQRGCKNKSCSGKVYLADDRSDAIINPTHIYYKSGREHTLELSNVLLSQIRDDEDIKIYYFAIPKKPNYQFLIPQFDGTAFYLGSHGLAVPPAEKQVSISSAGTVDNLKKYFDIESNELHLKRPSSTINEHVIIPKEFTWVVNESSNIQLEKSGCFLIEGSLKVSAQSSLRLEAYDQSGWGGLHFQNNLDLDIRNLYLDNAGQNTENVKCGERKYTGALSFYNTTVDMSNIHITNNRSEDALHILNSKATLKNSTIASTISDAIDSDYSVINFADLTITNAGQLSDLGGDAIDLSGSLAKLTDLKLINSSDKNISLGENSFAQVTTSALSGAKIGIAIKDASNLDIKDSSIQDTQIGITVYSKKPYYAYPEFSLESKDVTFKNVTNKLKRSDRISMN